jgi:imidazolonepropionase-like amidohydrolase
MSASSLYYLSRWRGLLVFQGTRLFALLSLSLLVSTCLSAEDLAFRRVSVVSMNDQNVLVDRTVLVSGDRIRAIGSADEILIPTGTKVIDGNGAFLMPGLCDMHVHFGLPDRHADHELLNRRWALQLLANGITTVRNMRGFPELLTLRAEIEADVVMGPQIYSTGPVNNGGSAIWEHDRRVETITEAIQVVRQDKARSFDAVKVYSGLNAVAYSQLLTEARDAGLPVYGHVPDATGLEGALEQHQDSIEHLSGYLAAIDRCQLGERENGTSLRPARPYDAATLRAIAQATRVAGTWNCPTLVLLQTLSTHWRTIPCLLNAPDARSKRHGSVGQEKLPQFAIAVMKALHEAGARVLVGTDADGAYVIHGYSIHQELSNFVSAGFTPYETLRASTADAAEFLRKDNEFGTVAVGKLANLILVRANPLIDIGNANRRIGIAVRGRWFSQRQLDVLLESFDITAQPATLGQTAVMK